MAAAGGGVRPSPIPGLLLDRCWQPVLLAAFVTTQPAPTLLVQVFAGAMAALAAMTVLSAALGWAAPNLVRPPGLANEHPLAAVWQTFVRCAAWQHVRSAVPCSAAAAAANVGQRSAALTACTPGMPPSEPSRRQASRCG